MMHDIPAILEIEELADATMRRAAKTFERARITKETVARARADLESLSEAQARMKRDVLALRQNMNMDERT